MGILFRNGMVKRLFLRGRSLGGRKVIFPDISKDEKVEINKRAENIFNRVRIGKFQRKILLNLYFELTCLFLVIAGIGLGLTFGVFFVRAGKTFSSLVVIFLIAGSCCLGIGLIFGGWSYFIVQMINNALNQDYEYLQEIYNYTLNKGEHDYKVNIENISPKLSLDGGSILKEILNKTRYASKIYNANLVTNKMNGIMEYRRTTFPFSIGTRLFYTMTYNGKSTQKTYFSFDVLTFKTQETGLETAAVPENITSFFKRRSRKEKENELESMEFEKLYSLEYDQPIKLRKYFTPAKMARIIDQVKAEKNVKPDIIIENNFISLVMPPRVMWAGPKDAKRTLMRLSVGWNIKHFIRRNTKLISLHTHEINTILKWLTILCAN